MEDLEICLGFKGSLMLKSFRDCSRGLQLRHPVID